MKFFALGETDLINRFIGSTDTDFLKIRIRINDKNSGKKGVDIVFALSNPLTIGPFFNICYRKTKKC